MKMKASGGVFLVIAAAVVLHPAIGVGAPITKQEFLKIYEPQATKLQEAYSHIRLAGREETTKHPAYPNEPRIESVIYRASGPNARLDVTIVRDGNTGKHDGGVIVRATTSERSFAAVKGPNQGAFALNRLERNANSMFESIRLYDPLSSAPYCFREGTILDFIRLREVTLTGFEEFDRDGEPLAKVAFSYRGETETKDKYQYQGWFLFRKDRCWALRERQAAVEHRIVTYRPGPAEIPIVAQVLTWSVYPETKTPSHYTTATVEEVEFVAPPESEFSLASLGLEEGGGAAGRRAYFLVAGVGGLILLILLMLLRSRVRSTSTQ